MEKPVLLTVSEVSRLLRIQRAKVYLLIETGALDGTKVGGDWRIRTDSIEKLIGELPLSVFNSGEKKAA
ncbi:DNA-binding protein [bacterium]|jgi:excisionase family DNA binding protein|nr:DNA-binding protein [bacterium]